MMNKKNINTSNNCILDICFAVIFYMFYYIVFALIWLISAAFNLLLELIFPPSVEYPAEKKGRRNYRKSKVLGKRSSTWSKAVKSRDNNTCQHCGSTSNSEAHHKDGYKWCVEGRTTVSNGGTLCETCHKKFHHIFGTKHNTEDQYKIFIGPNHRVQKIQEYQEKIIVQPVKLQRNKCNLIQRG